MKSLRQFLFDTKDLQAIFIVNRLEKTLTQITQIVPATEKEKITTAFYLIAKIQSTGFSREVIERNS